jgi:cyanate permease
MAGMATIGGVAYLVSACSTMVCGGLSDRWILAGGSPTVVRKTFTGGGMATVGVLIGGCAIAPPKLCVVLLIVGMVFFGASASNIWAISQRLAGPQAAGRWVGFQNGFGNLAGVIAPMITGFVLNRTGHFGGAFAVMTVVALLGAASCILVIGPVEQVQWGRRSREAATSSASGVIA